MCKRSALGFVSSYRRVLEAATFVALGDRFDATMSASALTKGAFNLFREASCER
jgi:hypothetical protein